MTLANNNYASVRLAEKRIEMQDNQRKNECECNRENKVNGVVCDVKNCAFHNGVNDCYAGSICVGPREADCSANTSCATFKPREC